METVTTINDDSFMSTLTNMPVVRGDAVYINGKKYTKAEAFPAYMQAYAGVTLATKGRQEKQILVWNRIKEIDYDSNKLDYANNEWQIFLDFYGEDVDN